jgi:hypothetical protein
VHDSDFVTGLLWELTHIKDYWFCSGDTQACRWPTIHAGVGWPGCLAEFSTLGRYFSCACGLPANTEGGLPPALEASATIFCLGEGAGMEARAFYKILPQATPSVHIFIICLAALFFFLILDLNQKAKKQLKKIFFALLGFELRISHLPGR